MGGGRGRVNQLGGRHAETVASELIDKSRQRMLHRKTPLDRSCATE
jgi:hypothetical protein